MLVCCRGELDFIRLEVPPRRKCRWCRDCNRFSSSEAVEGCLDCPEGLSSGEWGGWQEYWSFSVIKFSFSKKTIIISSLMYSLIFKHHFFLLLATGPSVRLSGSILGSPSFSPFDFFYFLCFFFLSFFSFFSFLTFFSFLDFKLPFY